MRSRKRACFAQTCAIFNAVMVFCIVCRLVALYPRRILIQCMERRNDSSSTTLSSPLVCSLQPRDEPAHSAPSFISLLLFARSSQKARRPSRLHVLLYLLSVSGRHQSDVPRSRSAQRRKAKTLRALPSVVSVLPPLHCGIRINTHDRSPTSRTRDLRHLFWRVRFRFRPFFLGSSHQRVALYRPRGPLS